MNIEKVKEALEQAKIHVLSDKWPCICELLDEALAELEESEWIDFSYQCAFYVWSECVIKDDTIPLFDQHKATKAIQQYAEKYHSNRCAECVDRSAPRFPETRSGVTTDVDK